MRTFIIMTLLLWVSSSGAVTDTLFHYSKSAGNTSYTGYVLQVARFEPAAPCTVKSILVTCSGLAGSARLHLYGHEAGTSFPQLEEELITPDTISKGITGIQVIQIDLDTPLYMPNNQFFIGFTDIVGLRIASDNVNHGTSCSSSSGGDYYYQFLKDGSGNWYYASSAFKIDVIVEYPKIVSPIHFKDVTAASGIDTSLPSRSIAWADFNGDSQLDLLISNRLYKNTGPGSFTDITVSSGLDPAASVQASGFADMNNDGDMDLIWILSQDTIIIYENNGNETFTAHLVENLSGYRGYNGLGSFSLADINQDKYPDLFISRLWTEYVTTPDNPPNYLFLNDQNWGLTDNTSMIYPVSWVQRRSRGSMWVDFDNDTDLDLYVTNYYLERDELWRNNGNNTFTEIIGSKGIDINATSSNHGTGVDWYDYDNDGDMDLLLPQLAHPNFQLLYDHRGTTLYRNDGPPAYNFTDLKDVDGIEYEETHAGGAWGDADNDGFADIYITTYYGCRYVDLYLQQPDHSYKMESFDFGIHQVVTGEDGAWADYDNDGRLDLASGKNGAFRLFRNDGPFWSNFTGFELVSTSGNHHAIGARVIVYAGGKRFMQEISAGRGQRIQKPARLHFGLGSIALIDSVAVRWPNGGQTEKFTGLNVNTVYRLTEGGGTSQVYSASPERHVQEGELIVYPNPFGRAVYFEYGLSKASRVELTVFNLTGQTIFRNTVLQNAGRNVLIWEKDTEGSGGPRVLFYNLNVNGVFWKSGKVTQF